MFDVYARTFMNATRNLPERRVRVVQRRGWIGRQTATIDLDRL